MAAAAVETPLMTSRVAALHRLPEHVQVVALTPIAPPPLQPLFVATRLQPRETEFTDPIILDADAEVLKHDTPLQVCRPPVLTGSPQFWSKTEEQE